jgi:hypothetical protein
LINLNYLVALPSDNAANIADEKWKPKKCVEIKPSVFLELTPDASPYIAGRLLGLCLQIVHSSIIHDDACGAGVVTNEIMKETPSAANKDNG